VLGGYTLSLSVELVPGRMGLAELAAAATLAVISVVAVEVIARLCEHSKTGRWFPMRATQYLQRQRSRS